MYKNATAMVTGTGFTCTVPVSSGSNQLQVRAQDVPGIVRERPIRSAVRSCGPLLDTQECAILTHQGMRTNIDIDDQLMRQAMRGSGAKTKRAVVEEGLRLLIQTRGQASLRRMRGKVTWQGDLHTSRLDRVPK